MLNYLGWATKSQFFFIFYFGGCNRLKVSMCPVVWVHDAHYIGSTVYDWEQFTRACTSAAHEAQWGSVFRGSCGGLQRR